MREAHAIELSCMASEGDVSSNCNNLLLRLVENF
jgi:hypothetical protein